MQLNIGFSRSHGSQTVDRVLIRSLSFPLEFGKDIVDASSDNDPRRRDIVEKSILLVLGLLLPGTAVVVTSEESVMTDVLSVNTFRKPVSS